LHQKYHRLINHFQTHPMVLLGDEGLVELYSVHLKIVLLITQDRCTVCTERTIGS
jgi:hypothetical protein